MKAFDFIGRYFWLVAIAGAGLNYLLMDRLGNAAEDAQVDRGLRRRYLGWLWGLTAVPFVVLGIGQLTGRVPSVWAIFRPQDGNPYVWAFFAAIALVYGIVAYWVLFRDGARIAEQLRFVRYQVQGRSGAVSAFWIKVMAIVSLPFLAFWLWVATRMDVKLPM